MCFNGLLLVADVHRVDVSNVAYRADYTQLNDCLDNLLNNPYSSPDYVFYQVEQISLCIKAYTGKHFHLKSNLQQFEKMYKSLTGQNPNEKWMKSISNYMDKRDALVTHHNYCYLDEEHNEFSIEDVTNIGCFAATLNYYDEGKLRESIGCSQQIAPWTIDDVPPKITFSLGSFVAGCVMVASGSAEIVIIGNILQSVGLGMFIEHSATSCQRQHDDRHAAKQDPNKPVDIRQFRNGH